jgi:hypothetical protein
MIVNRKSLAFRLFVKLPMFLPFFIERVRVGNDITSFVRIGWR